MNDVRINFGSALNEFRAFLRSQDWHDDILWLTRERITGHKRTHWIFRPDELVSEDSSRLFYESLKQGNNSIRIDAFCQFGKKTIAYVEDYGGDSKCLNYGILQQSPALVRIVCSEFTWIAIRLINKIRGESSFLKWTKITKQT